MEFTKGYAHEQNFIKFCVKIVYYMSVPSWRYLSIHLFQFLNINNFKFQIKKKIGALIKSDLKRPEFGFFYVICFQHDAW